MLPFRYHPRTSQTLCLVTRLFETASGSVKAPALAQGTSSTMQLTQGRRPLSMEPRASCCHDRRCTVAHRLRSTCLSVAGARATHGQIKQDARAVAAGLLHGLQLQPAPFSRGNREQAITSPVVLLHLPNRIQFVVLELGAWAAGLTVYVSLSNS